MKLTNIDINELLPIYAQGQPIANAIGNAVASALGGIFARCESLPCEASRIACDAMRDDELDAVAKDLQIVIYDPSASHEEKARFVYEFAGTRYTAGTYANIKTGLSIFADIPEYDVRIERDSTWHYLIQLESPPAVSIERQRIMERLIPKAHRAVLGFDGMDIHYSDDGESRLFMPAGNACADILVKGKTTTRAKHSLIARQVRDPSDTKACEIAPAEGSIVDSGSIIRARPYALSMYGDDYYTDMFMREDDMATVLANCRVAFKNVHDGLASAEDLSFEYDYTPEPYLRTADPDLAEYFNAKYQFRDALSPLPVFGLKRTVELKDLSADAYFADITIHEQFLNAACNHKVKRYCIGVSVEALSSYGLEEYDDEMYYLQGVFDGDYPEIFGAFINIPYNYSSIAEWREAFDNGSPKAYYTWSDVVASVDATQFWGLSRKIDQINQSMSDTKRLSELTYNQWRAFLFVYPREWA
ncbi:MULTISPECIES: hypothetical protein [Bacteria]|uniref:hypothetical protein n=1 Tax=Bacteria TaxID=2 RepID=UPI00071E1A0B|nr:MULTISPECIES: hypothetical protein [Bacteria]KSV84452.1 hypothetical protein N184_33880 [Sinorhizobium sp. GL28]